jgi:HEXXH motif-containing protein
VLTGIRLPAQEFHRIAAGGPSGASAELLRAGQDSRRVLRVLDAIGGGPQDAAARPEPIDAALRLLDLARQVPGAERAALGHPSVGPWALECAHGTAPVEHLASVAAAAGIRAELEFRLTVPVLPRGVVLPGIGVLQAPAGERTALVEGGPAGWRVAVGPERYAVPIGTLAPDESVPWLIPTTLALGGPGLPRWAPAVEYADPYLALPPGAPDVHPAPLPRAFRGALARAWHLLVLRHGERAEDLAATLNLLVPLRPVAGSYANASRPDAFGAAWLDVTAPPHRLAAALVHELEHARLTALHDLVPLHTADPEARHRVPWRPVPRPVHALLQGLYAHAAVVEFWRAEAATGDDEARREFERYRGNARRALADYTDRGSLTPAGRELVAALEARIGAYAAELTAGQVTVSPSKQKSRPRRMPPGLEEATVEVEQAPSPAAASRPEPPANAPTAIIFASMDRMWAEWIREQYERAGYATVLERYSSSATRTLAEQLDHGLERYARVVVLFSAPFMVAVSGSPEQWTEAIAVAASATERVVPVLVGRCTLPAGFWQVTPVNLFGVEQELLARHRLLRRTDGLEEAHEAALNLTDPQSAQADGSFVRYPGRAPDVINGMPGRNTKFTGRREHLLQVREGLTENRVTLVPQRSTRTASAPTTT